MQKTRPPWRTASLADEPSNPCNELQTLGYESVFVGAASTHVCVHLESQAMHSLLDHILVSLQVGLFYI